MSTTAKGPLQYPVPITDGGTGAINASNARTNLGITIGARSIFGTLDQITVTNGTGASGNPTISIALDPIVPGTGAIIPPTGNTAERPISPDVAMFRGNSQTGFAEIWSNEEWVPISDIGFLKSLSITATHTALAVAAHVTLLAAASVTATYRITDIQLNGFGTNFSGGSGDRDLSITDGTSVWSVIPAATLQALANAKWGSADAPFPASIPLNTASIAGDSIYAVYSGGTTDYTAGSLVITLVYERVT